MASINDTALIRLAADGTEPLLPMLDRPQSYRSLVGVLAIIPCLIALDRRGLSDAGAVWALRAVVHQGISEGVAESLPAAMAWQPPLMTWLDELLLSMTVISPMVTPLVFSVLATVGCVWWGYRLFFTLGEQRQGYWAAVFLALQGGLMLLATLVTPTGVSLLLALVAADAWFRHLQQEDATVTIWLLVAGIAAGGCLLAGGPVVFPLFLILLLQRFLVQISLRRAAGAKTRGRIQPFGPSMLSLGVMGLTAFAVGGWWVMKAAATGGMDFWAAWFGGYDAVTLAAAAPESSQVLWDGFQRLASHMAMVIGPILPLTAYGLWRSFAGLFFRHAGAERSNGQPHAAAFQIPALMLVWFLVACLCEFWDHPSAIDPSYRSLADGFLIFPSVGCAAIAAEAVLQRKTSLAFGLILGACVIVMFVAMPFWSDTRFDFQWTKWRVLTAIPLMIAGVWAAHRWARDREARRKLVLVFSLLLTLGLVFTAGLIQVVPQPVDENRLYRFRSDVAKKPGISNLIFVSDRRPAARLEYSLRSLYPDAAWNHARSWTEFEGAIEFRNIQEDARILVVEWTVPHKTASSPDLREFEIVSAVAPRFYRTRELRAYVLKRAPKNSEPNVPTLPKTQPPPQPIETKTNSGKTKTQPKGKTSKAGG